MGTSTFSLFDKMLMDRYNADIFDNAFSEDYVGWKIAKKKTGKFEGGRQEIFPVQFLRGAGVGARGEVGTVVSGGNRAGLPSPGAAPPVNGTVTCKQIFGVLEWSAKAILSCKGSPGSFKELINHTIKQNYSRLQRDMNFWFHGDGTGKRAIVATTSDTLTSGGGTLQIEVDASPGTRYLNEYDKVVIFTSADTAYATYGGGSNDSANGEKIWVKSVDDETHVTLQNDGSQNVTITADQIIRVFGESEIDGTRVDHGFTGMSAAIDDGTVAPTYLGITRSSNPMWESQIINAASAQLDEDHIILGIDKVARKLGKMPMNRINIVMWDQSIRRDYVKITRPDRRFSNIRQLDAGYDSAGLQFTAGDKELPLIEDVDFPFGEAIGFNTGDLEYYELSPMQLDSSTGAVLKMGVPYGRSGTGHLYWAMISAYGEFVHKRPYCAFRIRNLDYSLEA